jgi:hypothetical protein
MPRRRTWHILIDRVRVSAVLAADTSTKTIEEDAAGERHVGLHGERRRGTVRPE